jgi:hypothetical protein
VSLVAAACVGAPVPTRIPLPAGRVPLPDYSPCVPPAPSTNCVFAGHAVFGTLHEAGECIWMVTETGSEVRVIWPYGYSAQFKPFVVFDNGGKEVARDGDRLEPEGTGPFEGDADSCGRTQYVYLIHPMTRAATGKLSGPRRLSDGGR